MDNIQIIEKARRGDHDAFRILVESHARPVYRLAFRMTGNAIDAEDVSQETFLKAWKQIGNFDGRASFGTWLHRICANCSVDLIRSRKRRETDADVADPQQHIASPGPSPERIALSGQVAAMLGPALDELSGMERAAFVLRHFEGMGIEEISVALGVLPGAAKHSVFRAVQKLRRTLRPAMSASR
ncbi:MAG: sigma-70 family RNA polymerase sigma factor [Terriglobia bacterium]